MRKFYSSMVLVCLISFLAGCATMVTGLTSSAYKDAPVILAYSDSEVIRDQSRVATLIVPADYGLIIDGLTVKELEGQANPSLRASRTGAAPAYIVDVLPGAHKLTVTYNAMAGAQGSGQPQMQKISKSASVGVGYSGPSPIDWIRTSETSHTLKGGEVYAIGLKMMSIGGEMDLYALSAGEKNVVGETRNNARF